MLVGLTEDLGLANNGASSAVTVTLSESVIVTSNSLYEPVNKQCGQ